MRGRITRKMREVVVRVFAVVIAAFAVASVMAASAGLAPAASYRGCIDVQSVASRGPEGAREPDMGVADDVPADPEVTGGGAFRATVPTYVHVISPDGVEGNLPLSKVEEQIRVLDLSFGGSYGGVDTGFDFELMAVDYTVNADWYNAGYQSHAEREMKDALRQGGTDALNIYLATADIYLGWATFPSALKAPGQVYRDGVIVDWKSLPGMGEYPRFDLGLTATHEVGHWLGLYHTFQGGCNRWGDYVEDTPPQRTPSFGCPEGKDTCADAGLDPIHNYMDYSDDPCYSEFTAGQAERMHDAWRLWRD